jgi:hypothetical protein
VAANPLSGSRQTDAMSLIDDVGDKFIYAVILLVFNGLHRKFTSIPGVLQGHFSAIPHSAKRSGLHDPERLCALASLRENSLLELKNSSRKAAETQRKMVIMVDSQFHDPLPNPSLKRNAASWKLPPESRNC